MKSRRLEISEDWLSITEGAVIRAPSGRLRVVRKVSRGKPKPGATEARRINVFMTICHPSWTNRAYTLYSVAELACLGYTVTKARVYPKDNFHQRFKDSISSTPVTMTAAEVIGIP